MEKDCTLRRIWIFLSVIFAIRELRMPNTVMNLKPQDVVVLLKLCIEARKERPPYSKIAAELRMSVSEVHGSIKRLQKARLLHGPELGELPINRAAVEFIIHGVKYAFPAERGEITRGIPTSYAAEPLNRLISAGDEPVPVWPDKEGTIRGVSLKPMYKTVPQAAKQDPRLYEALALLDAVREGRARERKLAEEELLKRIKGTNG